MQRHTTIIALVALAASTLSGCSTGSGTASLDTPIAAYDNGEYSKALELASTAADNASSSRDEEEAAYLAGMSAYRLGQWTEAERWLVKATQSGDEWLAGQAGVTLGSAQLKLGKHAQAAKSFSRAADKLDAEEAKKARIAAANAYRAAGDSRMADVEFKRADVPATTQTGSPPEGASPAARSGVTRPASGPQPGGPFVLQAGAFRDESKARKRAEELRGKAVQSGFGEPRVLPKKGADGGLLYIVQIGSFRDRSSADAAVARLGTTGVVVGRPVATS